MLSLCSGSDTAIVVLHEIYGINRHVRRVCQTFYYQGMDVYCPSLYSSETVFSYDQQDEAYRHFSTHVKFEQMAKLLQDQISDVRGKYRRLLVGGYSVGATLAWLMAGNAVCDGIIGVYGSRIRDYSQRVPLCPVLLFFPQHEPSFNVTILTEHLQNCPMVRLHRLPGVHGCCDPYSTVFVRQAHDFAWSKMSEFIQTIRE